MIYLPHLSALIHRLNPYVHYKNNQNHALELYLTRLSLL